MKNNKYLNLMAFNVSEEQKKEIINTLSKDEDTEYKIFGDSLDKNLFDHIMDDVLYFGSKKNNEELKNDPFKKACELYDSIEKDGDTLRMKERGYEEGIEALNGEEQYKKVIKSLDDFCKEKE